MLMKKYRCRECSRQIDTEHSVEECEYQDCQSENIEYIGSYRPFD